MYAHMYICGDVQASRYTCGGQKRKMGILLGQSPLYSLRQGLSLNLELTVDQTGCCPASPTTPYLCHPPHWGHRHMQPCLASTPPNLFFYVYVCGFVHMHSGACRGPRGQISLEEDLRTELWSSGRTVHALNHCALSSPCLASYGDAEVLNLGHACAGRILYPLSYLPVQHFFWKIIHVKTPHMNLFMQRSQKT